MRTILTAVFAVFCFIGTSLTSAAQAADLKMLNSRAHIALQELDVLMHNYKAFSPTGKEGDCLARAIYHEARGEDNIGMLVVADVIFNRMESRHRGYPNTLCGVVHQKRQAYDKNGRQLHQFEFLDVAVEHPKGAMWKRAQKMARVLIHTHAQDERIHVFDGSVLYFHAGKKSVGWFYRKVKEGALGMVAIVGNHLFYEELPIIKTASR